MRQLNLTFVLAVLMSMAGGKAMAYDAEIDGIYYNFTEEGAEVTYPDVWSAYDYKDDIVIPKTVVYEGKTYKVSSIGNYAFQNRQSLKTVTCLAEVTTIGQQSFEECISLVSISLSNGLISIGREAFKNCKALTSITIPNSVRTIRYCAFYGCTSLASVIIPNTMEIIEGSAFYECI